MASSKGSVFRIFNPSGRSKEESVEKRREQVRRAQHVYRQRKTRYVKSLEGDIAISRQRERDMARNQQQLESQVRVLSHLLQQHSIPVPDFAGLPHDSVIASPQFLKQNVVEQHHPEWPQASTLPSPLNSLSPHSNADSTLSSQISFFDQTVVGMQFILKIEEPCLGHVHGDASRPEDPSNHALTVTSQILCVTSQPPPPRSSLLPVQDVHADVLSRLLQLAPAVSKDDELTPVQAWDQLSRKPVLGSLDLGCLMTLAERLRDNAKCHGFGAVLTHDVFDQEVEAVMRSKISFAIQ